MKQDAAARAHALVLAQQEEEKDSIQQAIDKLRKEKVRLGQQHGRRAPSLCRRSLMTPLLAHRSRP